MWENIKLNSNLIQGETGRAYLIKVPKQDWLFWYPSKLVRIMGKNGYLMSLGLNSDMTFKLFRNGKGQYNRFQKVEEKEVNFKTMLRILGASNDND